MGVGRSSGERVRNRLNGDELHNNTCRWCSRSNAIPLYAANRRTYKRVTIRNCGRDCVQLVAKREPLPTTANNLTMTLP